MPGFTRIGIIEKCCYTNVSRGRHGNLAVCEKITEVFSCGACGTGVVYCVMPNGEYEEVALPLQALTGVNIDGLEGS